MHCPLGCTHLAQGLEVACRANASQVQPVCHLARPAVPLGCLAYGGQLHQRKLLGSGGSAVRGRGRGLRGVQAWRRRVKWGCQSALGAVAGKHGPKRKNGAARSTTRRSNRLADSHALAFPADRPSTPALPARLGAARPACPAGSSPAPPPLAGAGAPCRNCEPPAGLRPAARPSLVGARPWLAKRCSGGVERPLPSAPGGKQWQGPGGGSPC